jgi:hypothetical protein
LKKALVPVGLGALALWLAVVAGPPAARPAQDSLKAFLPADGAVAGWSQDGQPQEFAGEDLYTYIDGGAEIYQEYGFRRVVVQDYKNGAGKSVSLEIFEMASPEAAYGIFTFKRSGRGRIVGLGSEGELEDYYLNFWKGPYLVTLTGFDGAAETLGGLQAVGAAVEAKIADTAPPPALVRTLPVEGLDANGLKYLKGPLGLSNVYSFYTGEGLRFAAALKAGYADGSSLIVLDYGTDEARAKAWPELRAGLEASGKFKPLAGRTGEEPVYQDPKGRFVAFRPSASRLLVAIAASAPAALNRTH